SRSTASPPGRRSAIHATRDCWQPSPGARRCAPPCWTRNARWRSTAPWPWGGAGCDELLRAEVGDRDRADTDRTESPLRPAPDAHRIDTDRMDVETMVGHALDICRSAGLLPARPR